MVIYNKRNSEKNLYTEIFSFQESYYPGLQHLCRIFFRPTFNIKEEYLVVTNALYIYIYCHACEEYKEMFHN